MWFAAPLLLGGKGSPVLEAGPPALSQAKPWRVAAVGQCGPDVRIDLARTVESHGMEPVDSEEA